MVCLTARICMVSYTGQCQRNLLSSLDVVVLHRYALCWIGGSTSLRLTSAPGGYSKSLPPSGVAPTSLARDSRQDPEISRRQIPGKPEIPPVGCIPSWGCHHRSWC